MKRLKFTVTINAPRERVWNTMLAPETYRLWTAEFAEGSSYEGTWEKGSRIRFIGPDGSGMSSLIAENRPFEFVSIQHLGYVKNNVEDLESQEARNWSSAFENYSFSDADGSTLVTVEMDVTPEFEQYMANAWPKALARLKELCEARTASGSASPGVSS
jgi:uncharacterized protein YndB with AHSA1/START domain